MKIIPLIVLIIASIGVGYTLGAFLTRDTERILVDGNAVSISATVVIDQLGDVTGMYKGKMNLTFSNATPETIVLTPPFLRSFKVIGSTTQLNGPFNIPGTEEIRLEPGRPVNLTKPVVYLIEGDPVFSDYVMGIVVGESVVPPKT